MRVTSNSFSDSLVSYLQTQARRQASLQTQIASGQRVQDASDDPLAAQEIFNLRDQSVAAGQYEKNIQVHQEFASSTQSALQSLQKVLNRAQEIAISADGLHSEEDLRTFGTEATELVKEALQIANSQYRGEYIFGGTKTDQPAFSAELDNEGRIQSVEFKGTTSQASSEIAPGILVTSRIAGENRSGSGEVGLFADGRSGADLFTHLIALQNQLLSGDSSTIQNETRANLAKDEDHLLYQVAGNGTLQARLESQFESHKDHELEVESTLSQHTDIDYSEVIVRLSKQQTAYQATLQSAGSVLNLSLLSYLR
jgi:flagellar hook-associated protein 3 FlgL